MCHQIYFRLCSMIKVFHLTRYAPLLTEFKQLCIHIWNSIVVTYLCWTSTTFFVFSNLGHNMAFYGISYIPTDYQILLRWRQLCIIKYEESSYTGDSSFKYQGYCEKAMKEFHFFMKVDILISFLPTFWSIQYLTPIDLPHTWK